MISALLGLLGVVLVVTVIVDLLWTTVAAGAGGGPGTIRLANTLWLGARRITRPRQHRLLQAIGVGVTLVVIGAWIAMLLLGWFLIFSSAAEAVVDSTTRQPAGGWSRLYYSGFTVFTLGVGDYVAGGPVWQVATVIATGTGLTLVTLAITYVLSVTTSVTQRRALAAQISALGRSPTDVLGAAWNGSAFSGLSPALNPLVPSIGQLAQRHLAFPVLHYFHSAQRQTAIAPSIAVLDEVLTVLQHGVVPEHQPPALTIRQLRNVVGELLEYATGASEPGPWEVSSRRPPMPLLEGVRSLGIPVVDEDVWRARVTALAPRRQQLSAYLAVDGWRWSDVWVPDDDG